MPEEQQDEVLNPEELFRPIDIVRANAPPLEPLWGDFLFRKAVTSVVGDPGICKTSLGYGLAGALCLKQPFLGIKAEEPVRVLYMDFESADPLVSSRANFILGDVQIPNFFLYNSTDFYLNQIAKISIDFCLRKHINLVFVDNQTAAFNTRDENDNSEAARQMRFIRQFANECNTAVIIFHHTSKANLFGVRKGTGAFARARLADICINLDYPNEDDKEIIRWDVPKNRLIDNKPLWYIKKMEGKFELTDPPLGVAGKPRVNTLIYRAQQDILALLNNNNAEPMKREAIIISLPQYVPRTVDEALDRLKRLGRVSIPRFGYYNARGERVL